MEQKTKYEVRFEVQWPGAGWHTAASYVELQDAERHLSRIDSPGTWRIAEIVTLTREVKTRQIPRATTKK